MAGEPAARTALIIPALNEEESIGATLDGVPPGLFAAVIVADNGSTDRTADIARRRGATVVFEPHRGYGAACLRALASLPEGIQEVVFMQADASEDPREATELLGPILSGQADLVIGSRTLGKPDPGALAAHQAIGNRLATFLVERFYGYRYSDLGPFRAIRLDALRRLGLRERGYGWTIEMQIRALQHGLRVVEVPVRSHRRIGVSKVSGKLTASVLAGLRILWTVFKLCR